MNYRFLKIKNLAALILCTLIVFSVTACEMFGTNDENEKKTIYGENIEHTIGIDQSSAENANPQYGGSIAIFSYKPDTLCPILTNNSANMQMLNIIYDGLVDIERDLSVSPSLAAYWNVSDDARVWNITLRDGVKWHDGTDFTIDDVKYTIEQIRLNKDSYYYENISNINYVKGSGVNLEIGLKEANSEFIKLLSFPIIKHQSGNADKDEFVPNGTGAFIYEDRNEGNMYHLVRNDLWWNGRAYLDEVTVKLLPDKDTALYSFSSGALSLTPTENSGWGSFIDSTTDSFLSIPTNKYTFIGLNNMNNSLNRQEVRQIINYVINREDIVNDVFMSNGIAASTPINGNSYVFSEEYGRVYRDTEKAKRILEENEWEYKDGCLELRERTKLFKLKFEILVNEENAVREQIANAVSKQLNEFGFSTTVKKVSFEEYNKLIAAKKYDMFIGTYELREDNDFRFMLEKGNVFGFSDEEIDTAMQNIRLSVGEDEKMQAYSEFQRLFNEKCPIIGLCFENDIMLYKTTLKGQLSPVYNDIYRRLDKIYTETDE